MIKMFSYGGTHQARATSRPPPMQAPLIAATIGRLHAARRSIMFWPSWEMLASSSAVFAAACAGYEGKRGGHQASAGHKSGRQRHVANSRTIRNGRCGSRSRQLIPCEALTVQIRSSIHPDSIRIELSKTLVTRSDTSTSGAQA